MNAIDQLKSVLCDPKGKCCIVGSNEDRAIIDRALQALAQPDHIRDATKMAAQPERPWVGLTDEDVTNALKKYHGWREFAAKLDAILKVKNEFTKLP